VKTSWGWREEQLPDGTIILNSPAGKTYVTTLGSARYTSPACACPPGDAPQPNLPINYCGERTAMVPKRCRTRRQDRAHRVAAERRQNHQARTTRKATATLAPRLLTQTTSRRRSDGE
jgi:hypothetical protein